MRKYRHVLLTFVLALAYVAVAIVNREFAWAWGRIWLAPSMMLAVLASILFQGVQSCEPAPRRAGTGLPHDPAK